jgi:hypothetical protein
MNELNELNTDWHPEKMLEVQLKEPDDFLKVRETLTRIGVASRKDKKLFQSCHILHKQGRYFIVHFKELFALDGKKANLSDNDLERRNTIAQLLSDWGLVVILNTAIAEKKAPLSQIKVLAFKEKGEWDLQAKYNIGKKAEPEKPETTTEPAGPVQYEPEPEPEPETEETTEESEDGSTEV